MNGNSVLIVKVFKERQTGRILSISIINYIPLEKWVRKKMGGKNGENRCRLFPYESLVIQSHMKQLCQRCNASVFKCTKQ